MRRSASALFFCPDPTLPECPPLAITCVAQRRQGLPPQVLSQRGGSGSESSYGPARGLFYGPRTSSVIETVTPGPVFQPICSVSNGRM